MSFGNSKIQAREKILEDLKKFVVGPDWEDEKEISIEFDPLLQYASAVLFPIQSGLKDTGLNLDTHPRSSKKNRIRARASLFYFLKSF